MPDRSSQKLYYKIGEVAEMMGLEPHVLRYWESEFPFLAPTKSASGQRVYTPKDLETVKQIKHLLYEEHYKIDGVKKLFKSRKARTAAIAPLTRKDRLARLRQGLQELLSLLQ